ncbi:hypothetical protein SEVIR_1G319200v4 [Setaria viridis]|uniref:Uncharacterized protein n=1 Tax=Setaria viridis TaxID=4556 RepID=A0A4U6WFA5_SETVI|nr:hypothetical protein SEVIR_1G319200v2 [Setaria viridis]
MSSSTSTMTKVMVAMLLVLVITSASATRAAARAFPGAQHASSGVPTNNDALPSPPPMRSSSSLWRGLHRLLLSAEEEKSGAGHSCGSNSKNIHCP